MRTGCILSLTTSGHGVGGAICIDGKIVTATTLERITREKYDIMVPISRTDLATFGWHADPQHYKNNIDLPFDLDGDYSHLDFNKLEKFDRLLHYLLDAAGIELKDVDCVAYSYRFNQSAEKYFKRRNPQVEFIVPEHHFSHACQAYLASPFNDAAIMVIDGQGVPLERTGGDPLSGCLAYGKGADIQTLWDLPVSYSLGGMYSHVTKICGFKTNEECKTMGLASYGTSVLFDELKKDLKFETKEYNLRNWRDLIERSFHPKEYLYSLGRYGKYLEQFKMRRKEDEITDTYINIAYAGQKLVEEVMIYLANWLQKKTGSKNLCISGGVGLNCVANYQVLANSGYENIFIYPNAGDNGLAVGQALYVHNVLRGNSRTYISDHDYLGKAYSSEDVKQAIDRYRNNDQIRIDQYENMQELYDAMASYIESGYITSWWQGRSEFGPRALGNRSILADPRNKGMKDILNYRVKFREGFRPFTPSVLKERAREFFTLDVESPFMLLAPYVQPGKAEIVPAITHVDNTARVQTVARDVNERYYDLIKAFEKKTGVPVLLNTSFNVAGEPIVETPEDAIKCFLSTDLDVLGIDNFVISKIHKVK
jgi:carbamoyltransferase